MRTLQRCCRFGLALLVLSATASSLMANEMTCGDYGVRIQASAIGFPLVAGDLRIEGAIGCGQLTVSAWGDFAATVQGSCSLGGEIRHTEGWVDLGLAADWSSCNPTLTVFSQASLPAVVLIEGDLSALAGTDLTAQLELPGASAHRIMLSPYLAGVLIPGDVIVRPSIGATLTIDSNQPQPVLEGTTLSSSLDLGSVLVSNRVTLEGLFGAFRSLESSITLFDLGVRASVAMIASGGGGFVYQFALSYEWGNADLLGNTSGQGGQICAGDVCF